LVLKVKSKLSKSPNSATIYLAIPASLTQDSQFPFTPNQEVEITINPVSEGSAGTLVISSLMTKKERKVGEELS
jgi:hypothetical protein